MTPPPESPAHFKKQVAGGFLFRGVAPPGVNPCLSSGWGGRSISGQRRKKKERPGRPPFVARDFGSASASVDLDRLFLAASGHGDHDSDPDRGEQSDPEPERRDRGQHAGFPESEKAGGDQQYVTQQIDAHPLHRPLL